MTRLYRRSRASRDAAMWAAVAADQRRDDLREKPWSVAGNDAQEARDAERFDRVRYVRVGGAVLDERDVPGGGEL